MGGSGFWQTLWILIKLKLKLPKLTLYILKPDNNFKWHNVFGRVLNLLFSCPLNLQKSQIMQMVPKTRIKATRRETLRTVTTDNSKNTHIRHTALISVGYRYLFQVSILFDTSFRYEIQVSILFDTSFLFFKKKLWWEKNL